MINQIVLNEFDIRKKIAEVYNISDLSKVTLTHKKQCVGYGPGETIKDYVQITVELPIEESTVNNRSNYYP